MSSRKIKEKLANLKKKNSETRNKGPVMYQITWDKKIVHLRPEWKLLSVGKGKKKLG